MLKSLAHETAHRHPPDHLPGACRSKIHVPIVNLKQGSVIKCGCRKAIKTTPDFLAVVLTMEITNATA
jgi:hypothetical protein